MKSKDYISKFKLDEDGKFNHSEFVEDLKVDFLALVKTHKLPNVDFTRSSFNVAVKDIRAKFDSIANNAYERPDDVWGKLWNYFFAVVVCPTRDEELDLEPTKPRNVPTKEMAAQ